MTSRFIICRGKPSPRRLWWPLAPERYGEIFSTRQEIDWPFQLGALKIVPYALGELDHWGQDLEGDPLNRAYGQAGVRASLPIWSVDPSIKSELFNVNGIAHKVVFEAEFAFADSNQNLDLLPLYNPLDDNSVEAERQRFRIYSYNSPPNPFPVAVGRALLRRAHGTGQLGHRAQHGSCRRPDGCPAGRRSAMADQARHAGQRACYRLDQPGHRHQPVSRSQPRRLRPGAGIVELRFCAGTWAIGCRCCPTGIFDFFDQGQKTYSVGAFLSRPPRGSIYLGFRQIEGPLDSRVITLSYTYWMSPKWLTTFGTTYDFGQEGNIGQNFSITRIGESFLVNLEFHRRSVAERLRRGFLHRTAISCPKAAWPTWAGPKFQWPGQMGWNKENDE